MTDIASPRLRPSRSAREHRLGRAAPERPGVRLIESNEDTLLYASGHIPGAVHVDWTRT
jgi:3-mercaptopyruvate sulfurtransferase SseA